MIAVIDYGVGNLHSVHKALEHVGGKALVTREITTILKADKLILPGVGAFRDGMAGLDALGLIPIVKEYAASGKPLLGICLGMQLLFDRGEEQGHHPGLGLLPGQVINLQPPGLKVPQIGWNQINPLGPSNILRGIPTGAYVYFNHSFYCEPDDKSQVIAITDYGIQFASAVRNENILGVQFHPEKSQKMGLQILKNFVDFDYE